MSRRKPLYTVFVGTDSGILKGIEFTSCGANTKNYPSSSTLDRGNEITALLWRDENEKEIYVGHRDRTVSLFDTQAESFIFRLPINFGKGKIVDITQRKEHILVAVESGHIGTLFKCEKSEQKVFSDTLHGVKCTFKAKPTLKTIKGHPGHATQFATGGCENNLKIWDIERPNRAIFMAKNVPNDMLDLRVPVLVSDLSFMHDNRTVAVVSRNKFVRLYDPRAKRRAVINVKYEDSPLTSICILPDRPGQVAIGTAHGRVTLFDLRMKIKYRNPVVYKGINGGIKDLAAASPDPPFVYSVSLDRYLRVHNIDTKKTVHKEYLKSRLTTVLVKS
uniref:WD repeat-containing protein 74-like n=1 Tax=Hirondellea gigas TaxID=1518452 RepID=A0A6A7FXF9_9CRUS